MKKIFYTLFFSISLCAKAQIVAGDSTSSNILFYNIPDTNITPPWKSSLAYEMDVDSSGTNDLKFFIGTASSPGFSEFIVSVYPLTNIQFVHFPSYPYADTIAVDSLIDQASNWQSSSPCTLHYFQNIYIPPPGSIIDAGLFKSGDKYLGFRLNNPADTLYGWIFLNSQGASLTVKSYAITASTSSIIFNENIMAIDIFPNPASDKFYVRGATNIQVEISLFDMYGREIKRTEQKEIDVSNLSEGIYFLQLKTAEGIAVKKIVISK